MSTIGDRILSLRKDKKLSQEALANMTGISDTYVGKLEKNNANATAKVLDNIANALDTTLNYLMYGEEKTEENMAENNRIFGLNRDSEDMLNNYGGLNSEDKEKAKAFLKFLHSQNKK